MSQEAPKKPSESKGPAYAALWIPVLTDLEAREACPLCEDCLTNTQPPQEPDSRILKEEQEIRMLEKAFAESLRQASLNRDPVVEVPEKLAKYYKWDETHDEEENA